MTPVAAVRTEAAVQAPSNALVIDDEDILIGRSNARRRTVLVIDGDPLVARSLALMLGAEGFVVETAAAGGEGIGLALARSFELIVLGAELPDMSGLEAMSRLRRAEVKAAIVFASVTPATVASAATLNLSDRHQEPARPRTLAIFKVDAMSP